MTDSDVQRVVRATLRCLREDLADEVTPKALRNALRTVLIDIAADPSYLLPCPLVDAQHAVLDKANQLATDAAAVRERIESLTDRYAIKVKTGDRRAALWQDDSGTWWLLAAGRRKNDTSGDFYEEIFATSVWRPLMCRSARSNALHTLPFWGLCLRRPERRRRWSR